MTATVALYGGDVSPAERRRWAICLSLILLAHAGVVIWLACRNTTPPPEPPVMLIDMAPPIAAPPAPEVQPTPTPPPPVPVPPVHREPVKPTPPKPVAKPQMAPVPQVTAPLSDAAPMLPAPPPEATTPAPKVAAQPVEAPAPQMSEPPPTYLGKVMAELARNRHYPVDAKLRHEEGTALVSFTFNRQGEILDYSIVKGSGFADLDEETRRTVQRSSPLPPPPDEMKGERLTMILPLKFFLK